MRSPYSVSLPNALTTHFFQVFELLPVLVFWVFLKFETLEVNFQVSQLTSKSALITRLQCKIAYAGGHNEESFPIIFSLLVNIFVVRFHVIFFAKFYEIEDNGKQNILRRWPY